MTKDELNTVFITLTKIVDDQGLELSMLLDTISPLLTPEGLELADVLHQRMLLIFGAIVELSTECSDLTVEDVKASLEGLEDHQIN